MQSGYAINSLLLSISIASIDMIDHSIFVQELIKILIIYMRTNRQDSSCNHSNIHRTKLYHRKQKQAINANSACIRDTNRLNTVQILLRCYLGWNGIISKPIGIFSHIIIPVYEWMRKYGSERARARACMYASRAHRRPIKENQRQNSIACLQSKLM